MKLEPDRAIIDVTMTDGLRPKTSANHDDTKEPIIAPMRNTDTMADHIKSN